MINQDVAKELVEQIGWELGAYQTYMGVSIYFERQSLGKWAKLFKDQAVEEAQHAAKIMGFLVDNDVQFDLPAMKGATTSYDSALAAVQATLDAERKVSERFRAMAATALKAGDHTSYEFLSWFIDEQVEEERMAQGLIDLVSSGINLFQAQLLLDDLTAE